MPGSRRSELSVLAPKWRRPPRSSAAQRPVRFIAVLPQELTAEARTHLPASIPIVTDCATDLLVAADAAVVKTGTSSLEAVLAGVPHLRSTMSHLAGPDRVVARSGPGNASRFTPCRISSCNAKPSRNCSGSNASRRKSPPPSRTCSTMGRCAGRCWRIMHSIRQALGSELPVSATERTAQIVEEMLQETRHPALASRPVRRAASRKSRVG